LSTKEGAKIIFRKGPKDLAKRNRIVSIPADGGRNLGIFSDVKEFADRADVNNEGKIKAFGEAIVKAALTYYGTAIDHYMRHVMAHFDRNRTTNPGDQQALADQRAGVKFGT
jgi:hypothetical protein